MIDLKKKSKTVFLEIDIFDSLYSLGINKSKLVNELLVEYFSDVNDGGRDER